MAKEIERKFLVADDSWRQAVAREKTYRQGYISELNKCSIRIRVAGDAAHLNIKSATLGISRQEYEYPLPVADAEAMLRDFSLGPVIAKTRYFVEHQGHTWEVDVFEGDNAGLIVAEVELADEEEAFARPSWLGKEVSDDPRYYNVNLVNHPYKDWADT